MLKVLLVEDEQLLRDMLREFMSLDRIEVSVCADGTEAIELWKKNNGQYDLIVTDFLMEPMNGLELANHLRTHDPDCRIVFTSAYGMNVLKTKHGFTDEPYFLQKPFDYGELKALMIKALENQAASP